MASSIFRSNSAGTRVLVESTKKEGYSDKVLCFVRTLSSWKRIVTVSLPWRKTYVVVFIMRRSLVSMEVGGPRMDSTCFFDMPSVTSSTLAFVIRLSLQDVTSSRVRPAINVAATFGIILNIMSVCLRACPQICVFAVYFIILKGDDGELLAVFVAINCFFVDEHVLRLHGSGRTENAFDLCLGHAGRDLVVVIQSELRTRQTAVASRQGDDHERRADC